MSACAAAAAAAADDDTCIDAAWLSGDRWHSSKLLAMAS